MSPTTTRPPVLTKRPLTRSDAPAILGILTAIEAAEPVDEYWSLDEVEEWLTKPGVDLPLASVGVLDGSRLVAFELVYASAPSAAFKATVVGGVHPEFGRRGIGTTLLQHAAEQAELLREADDVTKPGELRIWVDAERRSTLALAQATGFETWRYFSRMRLRLDAVDATEDGAARDRPSGDGRSDEHPAGVSIRRYLPEDDEAVRKASNASFADHWGSVPLDTARWRAEYADSSGFLPAHSFVATPADDPERVVGFLLAGETVGEAAARGYRTGVLDRIGTVRAYRGRGLASSLIDRSLADLRTAGFQLAELWVDSASPTGAGRIYERAGFRAVARTMLVGRRF